MQRGEGMAPFADVPFGMAAQRKRLDSSSVPKRDRSNNDNSSRDDNDTGRSGGGHNHRAGSKTRGNDDDNSGDKGKGGDENGNGTSPKGGHNGDDNNDGGNYGSRGGGDSSNANSGSITTASSTSAFIVPSPATITTSLLSTSTLDPGSDSNGAQWLSPEPHIGGMTSTVEIQSSTAVTATSTPAILSTSTNVKTGPDSVVTSYIPLIKTSAVVESTTTVISFAIGQAGAFGSDFPEFSDLPKPTNKGDANDDGAGRRHKGSSNSTTPGPGNKHSGKAAPLSPNAERALISVGSIGAFVIVCFLSWLVWRALRKHKQKKNIARGNVSSFDTSDGPLSAISQFTSRAYAKVASKVHFLNKQHKAWQSLEETSSVTSARNIAPMAMVTSNLELSREGHAASPINTNPRETGADRNQTFGSPSIGTRNSLPPSIPPQVYHSSGLGAQFQPVPSQSPPQQFEASDLTQNGAAGVFSSYSHSPSTSRSSAQMAAPMIALQQVVMPHTWDSNSISTAGQPVMQPLPVTAEQQKQQQQNQFATGDDTSVSSDTMRSHMTDPFYNQSQLARQPSDAYDPARREVNRASELSSLSSGFGDGELLMLVPEQLPGSATPNANTSALPMAIPVPAEPMSSKGQFSWMRNTNRFTRETVYSEASEDQPAKFRTVDSWVKQQTSRVRRGQASIDATADASESDASGIKLLPGHEPGIPHPLPEEQRLTMMMDDEEVPRRPDTLLVNSIGQQGPAFPNKG